MTEETESGAAEVVPLTSLEEVAHRIRNRVTVISGTVHGLLVLLEGKELDRAAMRSRLARIERSTRRIEEDLVHALGEPQG